MLPVEEHEVIESETGKKTAVKRKNDIGSKKS